MITAIPVSESTESICLDSKGNSMIGNDITKFSCKEKTNAESSSNYVTVVIK